MESKDARILETLIVRLIDEAEAISSTSPQQVEEQQLTSYFSAVMLLHNLVHEGLIAEKLGNNTDQQLRNKLIEDLLDVIELLRGPSSTTVQSGTTSSRSDARLYIARAQLGATTPKPVTVTPESDQLSGNVQPSPDIATSMLGAQHTAATTPAATTIYPTVTTQQHRRLEPITETSIPVSHSTTASRKNLPGGQLSPLPTTSTNTAPTTTTTTTTIPGRRKSVRLNPQVVEIEVKSESTPECTLASEYLTAALHRYGEERVSSVRQSVPVTATSVVHKPAVITSAGITATTSTITTTTTTTAKSPRPHYRTRRDSVSTRSSPSPWDSTEKERMSYLDHSLDLYERRMYTQQQQDSDTNSTSSRYVSPVVPVEGDYYDSDAAWILGTTQPSSSSSSSNYVYSSTYSTGRQIIGTERVSTSQRVAKEAHSSPTTTATSTASATSPIDYIPSSTPSSASSAQHRSQAQRRLRELLHLDPLPPHSSHSTATPTRQRPQRHSTGHK